MSLFKKSHKFIAFVFIFGISALSIGASTTVSKKKSKKSRVSVSKNVELVQTSGTIELKTQNGDHLSLPRYDQVYVADSLSAISLYNNITYADMKPSAVAATERYIEQKEMRELSAKLGIDINDSENLDFYREVADWLGVRYRLGGMSRNSVDCSGFTNIIYNTVFETKLPRVSTDIARNVKTSISNKKDLLPGDLVFFSTFGRKYINHVGIYIGDGHFVHASIKKGVIVSSLADGYYSRAWRKGGRMD